MTEYLTENRLWEERSILACSLRGYSPLGLKGSAGADGGMVAAPITADQKQMKRKAGFPLAFSFSPFYSTMQGSGLRNDATHMQGKRFSVR